MNKFNTINCALLAICLCTNLFPTELKDDDFLKSRLERKYEGKRPAPVTIPEKDFFEDHRETYAPTHAKRKRFSQKRTQSVTSEIILLLPD